MGLQGRSLADSKQNSVPSWRKSGPGVERVHPAGNVAIVTDPADDVSEPPVLVSASGGLGRLTLNRPRAINALNLDMVRRLHETLDRWEDDTEVDAVCNALIELGGMR